MWDDSAIEQQEPDTVAAAVAIAHNLKYRPPNRVSSVVPRVPIGVVHHRDRPRGHTPGCLDISFQSRLMAAPLPVVGSSACPISVGFARLDLLAPRPSMAQPDLGMADCGRGIWRQCAVLAVLKASGFARTSSSALSAESAPVSLRETASRERSASPWMSWWDPPGDRGHRDHDAGGEVEACFAGP